ncbi:MAG: HAD family hydrolase [Microthrixaceae bacterium]
MDVVLLDFFGTLVDYSPSRVAQGYERSHQLLLDWEGELGYAAFLARWSDLAAAFDAVSDLDDREFSMYELATEFLAEVLDRPTTSDQVDQLVATYIDEWNAGVTPIAGVAGVLAELARDYRLAVVTNTHHPSLVPEHLAATAVSRHIETVITSVEVGWRKPHPSIYRAALDAMQVDPTTATFVGDTRVPDYDGPRTMGMHALLIDPRWQHDIPEEHRLDSILDLPERLSLRA